MPLSSLCLISRFVSISITHSVELNYDIEAWRKFFILNKLIFVSDVFFIRIFRNFTGYTMYCFTFVLHKTSVRQS